MPAPQPLDSGQKAPLFSFKEGGVTVNSTEITTPYLVYFYPKDDTPGCTKEACAIRDIWGEFKSAGLRVIGVSKDPESSHEKFQAKYKKFKKLSREIIYIKAKMDAYIHDTSIQDKHDTSIQDKKVSSILLYQTSL